MICVEGVKPFKVHMPFLYDDGGRAASGKRGNAGDCVCRSIAIATAQDYSKVYDELAQGNATERGSRTGRTARNGIHTTRKWFKDYMHANGFEWTPCMGIGTGCKVHLVADELPTGILIATISNHYTTVLNGIIHDTHDPQRRTYFYDNQGRVNRVSERCVYGYWSLGEVR